MDFRVPSGDAAGMQAAPGVTNEVVGTKAGTGEPKRRRWSILERRQIVEETLVPGASVARVARAHGVNANQVFGWRRLYQRGLLGGVGGGGAALLPVKIADPLPAQGTAVEIAGVGRSGSIHVALGKAQIRIEGDVDREVLRMVLEAVLR